MESNYRNPIATVSTRRLQASNGKHIRKATLVKFEDGYEVQFLEITPRRVAVPMANKIELRCNRARLFVEGRL